MSTTPHFNLYKPLTNETGWGALVDANCDVIDTQMQASVDAAAAETAARIAADAAEVTARGAAVSSEATTRSTADGVLATAITSEATTRSNADALKANISSLSAVAFSGVYTDLTAKPQLAITKAATTSKFFTAYDAATGLFTNAQPAATDITGLAAVATSGSYTDLTSKPQLAVTKAAVTSNFFTAYDSTTGAFTNGQPAFTDVSGVATLAQLPTGYTWDKLGSAAGALTLANGTNNTTFNQTSAATWKWANTTPTFASLVLTQASIAGTTVTYTGTITGGAANAYVGATATIAGFVNAGNNGAFVVTASTATTLVVTNAGGVNETHAGTAVGAAQSSPTSTYSAQYSASPIATAEDTWTVQSVLASTAANAASYFKITHTGSTGQTSVVVPDGASTKPSIAFASSLTTGIFSGPSSLAFVCGAVNTFVLASNIVRVSATSILGFSSSDPAAAGTDAALFRSAAGVIGICGSSAITPANLTSPSANGAAWTHGQASELLVLSTVGLTTDTVGNLLPAGAIIDSVVCRVTTAITTTTNWAVGDASQAARFSSANATLTLGTTSVGLNQADPTVASANLGPVQVAAAKVRISCSGSNPGAGAIRITVFYRQFIPPAS